MDVQETRVLLQEFRKRFPDCDSVATYDEFEALLSMDKEILEWYKGYKRVLSSTKIIPPEWLALGVKPEQWAIVLSENVKITEKRRLLDKKRTVICDNYSKELQKLSKEETDIMATQGTLTKIFCINSTNVDRATKIAIARINISKEGDKESRSKQIRALVSDYKAKLVKKFLDGETIDLKY